MELSVFVYNFFYLFRQVCIIQTGKTKTEGKMQSMKFRLLKKKQSIRVKAYPEEVGKLTNLR